MGLIRQTGGALFGVFRQYRRKAQTSGRFAGSDRPERSGITEAAALFGVRGGTASHAGPPVPARRPDGTHCAGAPRHQVPVAMPRDLPYIEGDSAHQGAKARWRGGVPISRSRGRMMVPLRRDATPGSPAWRGDDRLREECGVFGVFGHDDAAALTALGLHALQHRGQEAAGIVTFDGAHFHSERRLGLVGDNFNKADVIGRLKGHIALGHNRYSTTGDTILRNVQPLFADLDTGGFAVAPQRQSHQRAHAAPRARLLGRHLPVDLRHRGHPAPDRPLGAPAHRRALRRRAAADRGRLCAGVPHQRHADRRARSRRHPPAGAGPARLRARAGLGDLRARYRRRRVRARDRERRDRHDHRRRHREPPPVPQAPGAPLHLRVHLLRAAGFHGRRAQRLRDQEADGRRSSRARRRPRPTSSSRSRIPACPPPSATPRRAARRSSSASSATTTWGAPSSSPSSASASSASSSSIPPTPPRCAATASC